MKHTPNNPQFRPPAEADSLILQVDEGCPYNACDFCGMYRGMRYRQRSLPEIEAMITAEARDWPDAHRVFLADGDALRRNFGSFSAILRCLAAHLPALARVNTYATGSAIDTKTDAELSALRTLKLHTLYLGLESGDEEILKQMHKGETAALMIRAGQRAAQAGLRISVMVLLGLGGPAGSKRHAQLSAQALNAMQPRLLSFLRIIPVPGTPLWQRAQDGSFGLLSEYDCVAELREMVAGLELTHTVLRANHTSNVVPLEARLPKDKPRLLAELDVLLHSGQLRRDSPGLLPMFL